MKKIVIFLVCILNYSSLKAEPAKTEPQSITDFKKSSFTSCDHKVFWYVAKHYRCPPCPENTSCKPCMGNNFLFSEKPEIIENYPENGPYLIVYTHFPESIKRLVKTIVTVNVTSSETTRMGHKDLKMVAIEYE